MILSDVIMSVIVLYTFLSRCNVVTSEAVNVCVYVIGHVSVTACAAAMNKNCISGWPLSVVHRYIISHGSVSEKWKIKNIASQKGLNGFAFADNRTCLVKRSLNQFSDHCFATAGPTLWNSLPEQLRQLDITFGQFKRSLKTFMFD